LDESFLWKGATTNVHEIDAQFRESFMKFEYEFGKRDISKFICLYTVTLK